MGSAAPTAAQVQVLLDQANARIAQLEAERLNVNKAKLEAPAQYSSDKEALTGFLV